MRSPFCVSVITLFPEAFPGPLGVSLLGKAWAEGLWDLETAPLRDFGHGKHKKVDDRPAGGGPGLVLRPDVAAAAIDSLVRAGRPLLYPSPRGTPFTQAMAARYATGPGLIVFCGRFEGLDQRVIEARGLEEVCVGEAVLMGGEAAAIVILEATLRLLPGVLGNAASASVESFSAGLLEHPQFTKPRRWEGRDIPEVLLRGDHAEVARWQAEQAVMRTRAVRPDWVMD
ncbi:MAG: tRNA (guanosine(37)-N1)-methyltransferase TrmD [Alphaproteobacteria bacterium]|jgi:tRNA (guanine37-N1)-methyltransferase|nr:tRNA (guanosine(37)-N1)-methyltransferase TrmD [Alphaproteobacteria bacterium]